MEGFKSRTRVPEILRAIADESRLIAMKPGEHSYVSYQVLSINEKDEVCVGDKILLRGQKLPKTSVSGVMRDVWVGQEVKIIRDTRGLLIDATNMTYGDALNYLSLRRPWEPERNEVERAANISVTEMFSPGEAIPVMGILYPLIKISDGEIMGNGLRGFRFNESKSSEYLYLSNEAIEAFNDEQRQIRKSFRQYYESTYGIDYVFALEEKDRVIKEKRKLRNQLNALAGLSQLDCPPKDQLIEIFDAVLEAGYVGKILYKLPDLVAILSPDRAARIVNANLESRYNIGKLLDNLYYLKDFLNQDLVDRIIDVALEADHISKLIGQLPNLRTILSPYQATRIVNAGLETGHANELLDNLYYLKDFLTQDQLDRITAES